MTPDPLERLLGGPDLPLTPRREFADALLDHLLATLAAPADAPIAVPAVRPEAGLPAPTRERPLPDPTAMPRQRPRLWFAAAALVLVALTVAYAVLRPDRSNRPASIPAPATPAPTAPAIPGVTQTALLAVTIPAEAIPAGRAGVSLHHLTLPAGVRTLAPGGHNIHLRYLISGVLTVRANRPGQLFRAASGAWEPLPADTEVTLGPGDAVLFLVITDIEFANPGPAPAQMLGYGLTLVGKGGQGGAADLADWIVNDAAYSGPEYPPPGPGIVLPGQAAVIRLSRAVVEPGASLPAPPVDRFRLAVAAPDDLAGTPVAHDLTPDGWVGNFGTTSAVVYHVTLEVPEAAGTPLAATPEP